MVCNLVVYDLKNTRNMFFATILVLLGVLFKGFANAQRQVFLFVGIVFYVVGWMYIGYNLQASMPENAKIFWPAIATIVATSFVYNATSNDYLKYSSLGVYSAAWLVFGYIMTNHLDGTTKYIGLIASVLAIGSAAFLDTPFGISGYTASLGVVTLVYGLPTISSITQDLPTCLDAVFAQIPELQGYETELNCLITSGCFSKLNTLSSLPTREAKVKLLADIVKCVANKCGNPTFIDLSEKFDCYVSEGCFNPIIDNPPTDPGSLISALFVLQGCITNKSNLPCPQRTAPPSIAPPKK